VRGVLERSAAGAAPFASPEHARNYFLRAVHSRALDVLRATRRERVQPLGGAAASEPEDREAEASLEEHEAAALRTERMRRALGRLRPDQREALGLRYLEGRSYREIAERLGVSISTLHSRVEASLEKLRERLRES
jgi:RNA polymerase sigma-70 factor (ECF subfamily)